MFLLDPSVRQEASAEASRRQAERKARFEAEQAAREAAAQAQREADAERERAKAKLKHETAAAAVAQHGTQGQRDRFAAGVLPDVERRKLVRKLAFGTAFDGFPRFRRLTDADIDASGEVTYSSQPTTEWSQEQWDTRARIEAVAAQQFERGSYTVTGRDHYATDAADEDHYVCREAVRLEVDFGGWSLSREFAVQG